MRSVCLFVMAMAMAGCIVKPAESHLEKGFSNPPDQVKPWTYWFFLTIIYPGKVSIWTWRP